MGPPSHSGWLPSDLRLSCCTGVNTRRVTYSRLSNQPGACINASSYPPLEDSSMAPSHPQAMPSIGGAVLRILRFILSLSTASSPRKHSKTNIVRTMCASSMPYPLEQREMSEASPSRIHLPVTTDASGEMGLATQPEDSITGNVPFHYSQHPVEVQPVGDRPRNMSRRPLVPASPEQVMQHRFLKRLLVDDRREPEEILKQGDMNYDASVASSYRQIDIINMSTSIGLHYLLGG
ncbi:hypothetical protein EDC04DRAFT_1375169 [Pisolithus marmoratus]|nr:hypothetical protein EDC04DRAFT_1375169 [Pisolithus marmoratus]